MTATEIKGMRKEVKHYVENADEHRLKAIYSLLKTTKEEEMDEVKDGWWDEISDGEKAAIEEGLRQSENGEGIPHEEAIKQLKWWPKSSS
jgi:predicted transcriptional regulator